MFEFSKPYHVTTLAGLLGASQDVAEFSANVVQHYYTHYYNNACSECVHVITIDTTIQY